ncbi:uncharacterized protein EI90DRAFT_2711351 [Cantharellus anzutake]|uniref:uncharacterized protein n=1 Tax=Cantharellus anzutake TaxID=1750568 RepID=UPI0019059010|nr:uncharacterized protein EI90DRAFT_2711351 [Cantharellus anzutake]KAF8318332.1 hypothetical protein EI90DRAFT_2711351 [Cantharellus anzutake]
MEAFHTSASTGIINEGRSSTFWDWIKWMGNVLLNLVIYVAPPVTAVCPSHIVFNPHPPFLLELYLYLGPCTAMATIGYSCYRDRESLERLRGRLDPDFRASASARRRHSWNG